MEELHRGTCKACGKPCVYVAYATRAYWVHEETGNYMSSDPWGHDCNTYVTKEESKP